MRVLLLLLCLVLNGISVVLPFSDPIGQLDEHFGEGGATLSVLPYQHVPLHSVYSKHDNVYIIGTLE